LENICYNKCSVSASALVSCRTWASHPIAIGKEKTVYYLYFVESMYKGIAQDRIIFFGGGVVKCVHLIQFERD